MPENIQPPCPLCGYQAVLGGSFDFSTYDCRRCGNFSSTARSAFDQSKHLPLHLLSGVSRNYWEATKTRFIFTVQNIESIIELKKAFPSPIPNEVDVPAKADLILHFIRRKTNWPGGCVAVSSFLDYPIAFCNREEELMFCISYLIKQEFLTEIEPIEFGDCTAYCITPEGWAYLSGIGVDVKEQGFIAMAFGLDESDELYRTGLIPGIRFAGYNPIRVDSKEHNNRIDDEIVAEIRKSKFVIADLTGKNAGAYFEAGFAMGLGKRVVWTCSQADLDKSGGVHFDTRQYNIVTWEADKFDDFVKRLTLRIEATIGHGTFVQDTAIDTSPLPMPKKRTDLKT